MTKAKKTRQQKIIADLHRKLQIQSEVSSPAAYTFHAKHIYNTPTRENALYVSTLPYIKHDLFKTTIVTAAIISAQLLLYYLLKTHLIMLPIGGY